MTEDDLFSGELPLVKELRALGDMFNQLPQQSGWVQAIVLLAACVIGCLLAQVLYHGCSAAVRCLWRIVKPYLGGLFIALAQRWIGRLRLAVEASPIVLVLAFLITMGWGWFELSWLAWIGTGVIATSSVVVLIAVTTRLERACENLQRWLSGFSGLAPYLRGTVLDLTSTSLDNAQLRAEVDHCGRFLLALLKEVRLDCTRIGPTGVLAFLGELCPNLRRIDLRFAPGLLSWDPAVLDSYVCGKRVVILVNGRRRVPQLKEQ